MIIHMLFDTLKSIKQTNKKAVLAFIFCSLLISANCGKRKPPLPPVERVAQRVEISGFQRGDKILLSWTMAYSNATDGSVLQISRADIYRLTENIDTSANSSLSEDEFASRSTLIATVPISDADFARKQITYEDTLNFAGQPARIRYAVRFVNASGQKAGFSNFLLFEPTAKVAAKPNELTYTVTQNTVDIRWQPPLRNIDDSTPPNILGFNIYRSDETNASRMLNTSPITGSVFGDRTFEFEKNYTYFVRTVSLGANGQPIESGDSEQINVTPKDVFPPSPPSAVTIAASPQAVSIFFASNVENDVVGYRVYRSPDRAVPVADWNLLTPQLLTTNTFQDTDVESGKTYFYYLTAIDRFGNVSDISEIVNERVP